MWRTLAIGVMCVGVAGCRAAAPPPAPVRSAAPPAAVVAPARTVDERRALFATAQQAVAAQRYDAARPALEALRPVYPELGDYVLFALGQSYARAGDGVAAGAAWEELLAVHPRSLKAAPARLELARLRRAQGDLDAARALLTTARGDDDTQTAALIELAAIEQAAGNPGGAYAYLTTARSTAPGTPPALAAKARLLVMRQADPGLAPRGAALDAELRLLITERDYAGARAAADRLLATWPAADRAAILRLRADAEQGDGQFDAGLTTLREIVRIHPDSRQAPEAQFRLAQLLWNRDRNAEAAVAFGEFRRRHPGHARMPEVLYALARIEQGDDHPDAAVAAYRRLIDAYPTSALAREARWRIGWIRYQQGRWPEAAAAFGVAAGGRPMADAADAYYWQARALERAGDGAAARRLYRGVAGASGGYYASAAEQRLGEPPPRPAAIAQPAPRALGAPPAGADPYHWLRARELQAAGLRQMGRAELRAFEREHPNDSAGALLVAYPAVDGYRDAIRLAQARGIDDPEVFYPLAFWPEIRRHTDGGAVDPLLVLALMRQESLFDPAARSPADARGLMQLLPSTAERVARSRGEAPPSSLYEPDANITLGVAYLGQLLQEYHGDPRKALAAYNGGEPAVAKWTERFGHLEPDEFVESITFRETRDYVKKVMGNHRRYQLRYGRD